MKKLLETVYIMTPESYLFQRNDNVCVSIGGEEKASVPISQVDSIVLFGKNTMSTSLLGFCAAHNVTITFLNSYGRFEGRLCGPVSGNVLLRKRQYHAADSEEFSMKFVCDLICAKIQNSKQLIARHARTADNPEAAQELAKTAASLSAYAAQLQACKGLDSMRGIEGAAASVYFSAVDLMLSDSHGFRFERRSKRPPENEVNAVLSFLYTQLTHDYCSAMESVGLDPAMGFMHTLRPGRPSFALDLMEELRSPLCDRLTLALFNRGQLSEKDFEYMAPAVYLNEKGRRLVLSQWRSRKQEEIRHPFLNEKVKIGLIPYVQTMLFARVLRGDLDRYPPFLWR